MEETPATTPAAHLQPSPRAGGEGECYFDWLADELVLHILSFLPHHPCPSHTALLLPAVCRRWAWVVRDRSLGPANLALADLLDGAEALRELPGLAGYDTVPSVKKGYAIDKATSVGLPLRWSVNALVCGPRGTGKSTLAGLLLYFYGAATQQELDRTKQELEVLYEGLQQPKLPKGNPYAGRDSTCGKQNLYSALCDRTREERVSGRSVHGHTRQVAVWPRCTLTLMDTPGSYELPKPFMSAAFGAQCAVVVVDATTILNDQHKLPEGAELLPAYKFFDVSPLKRVTDQLAVLRTNNVKRLIFLINKMDRVKYSQDVFEKVCAELLVLVGTTAKNYWPQNNLVFIPSSYRDLTTLFGPKAKGSASPILDEDLDFVLPPSSPYYTLKQKKDPKGDLSWFKGQNLLQALQQVFIQRINTAPSELMRRAEQPLRFCMDKVYPKAGGSHRKGLVVSGFVETGILLKGSKLFIWPADATFASQFWVFSMHFNRREIGSAYPGQWVSILLRSDDPAMTSLKAVRRGMVAVKAKTTKSIKSHTQEIMATISLTAHMRLAASLAPVLYCGTSVVPCKVVEVISKLDKVGKELPGVAHLKGHNALVKLQPLKPLFCEPFIPTPTAASAAGEKKAATLSTKSPKVPKRVNSLGQFVLRDNHVTFAVGSIQSVVYS